MPDRKYRLSHTQLYMEKDEKINDLVYIIIDLCVIVLKIQTSYGFMFSLIVSV